MNIYLWGIIIAMIVFVIIGFVVSKKVKNAEEFYVAGRNAPVLLISGSLVASYAATGLFMGDAGESYSGAFAPLILLAGMLTAGYIFGSVFFGRYLRRSRVYTIPEFFGKRFDSKHMRRLSAVTAIVTMTVYLLSVIQGIGTMMEIITGVDYRVCIIISMVVFTIISVTSGSRGVLITDTLMAALFTAALIVGVIFISKGTGGWYGTIESLAANPETSPLLSWVGRLGTYYDDKLSTVLFGVIYGITWMSVCAVGPWQVSRYQMARDESVVVKSAFWSSLGVFMLEFLACLGAVFVNKVNPGLESASHVLIWASMNLMPKILGIILLTGIFSAAISSATTFQSLIGSMFVNDVVKVFERKGKDSKSIDKSAINIGRIIMIAAALVVTTLAVFNPPAIFIIVLFGGSLIAGSWMPVAVASILYKKVTKAAAFSGMLVGFVFTFVLYLIPKLGGWSLPIYLEPCFVGMILNTLTILVVSSFTKVTPNEKAAREAMFVIPESEKDVKKIKSTLRFVKIGSFIGLAVFVIMMVLWIVPYYIGIGA